MRPRRWGRRTVGPLQAAGRAMAEIKVRDRSAWAASLEPARRRDVRKRHPPRGPSGGSLNHTALAPGRASPRSGGLLEVEPCRAGGRRGPAGVFCPDCSGLRPETVAVRDRCVPQIARLRLAYLSDVRLSRVPFCRPQSPKFYFFFSSFARVVRNAVLAGIRRALSQPVAIPLRIIPGCAAFQNPSFSGSAHGADPAKGCRSSAEPGLISSSPYPSSDTPVNTDRPRIAARFEHTSEPRQGTAGAGGGNRSNFPTSPSGSARRISPDPAPARG